MNIAEMHKSGLLDSTTAVKAALLDAGFTTDETVTLISTVRSSVSDKHYTKWNDDEIAILTEAYVSGVPVHEIAARLNRTVGVVRTMAMKRGLRRATAE